MRHVIECKPEEYVHEIANNIFKSQLWNECRLFFRDWNLPWDCQGHYVCQHAALFQRRQCHMKKMWHLCWTACSSNSMIQLEVGELHWHTAMQGVEEHVLQSATRQSRWVVTTVGDDTRPFRRIGMVQVGHLIIIALCRLVLKTRSIEIAAILLNSLSLHSIILFDSG